MADWEIQEHKQTNMMIHGGSVLSLTATAAETQQAGAWPAARTATALWSNRKKSTLYLCIMKYVQYTRTVCILISVY
jgi:hypothetical protein